MSPTFVLITGANRGLGKGLSAIYLAKPNHVVIAGVRNLSRESYKSLAELPVAKGSKLILVKLDSEVETDAAEAVKHLITKDGIDHLDLVIANAGISKIWPSVFDLKIADVKEHMQVNCYAAVLLYQATAELLRKSDNPKFLTMGSSAGWLENQLPAPNAAYAPSKTAVHWMTKRINAEEPKITAFVVDPGWCATDTGNASAQFFGFGEKAPVLVQDSVNGIAKLVDEVTKETHGGKLWGHDLKQQTW